MAKKKVAYVMLTDTDLLMFTQMINERMTDKWEIWGASTTPVINDQVIFCQAMVKYKDTNGE